MPVFLVSSHIRWHSLGCVFVLIYIMCMLLMSAGFNLAMNKQIMCELSGIPLGPPRLPLLPFDVSKACAVAQKLRSVLGEQ